jgi:ABC-type oligopeptide transport system ATPase subunit
MSEVTDTSQPLLEVTDLVRHFPVRSSGIVRRTIGQVQAVDGVSFSVQRGSSLGLVGESGCGKSTTGRVITRLIDPTSGSIKFEGKEIGGISQRQMRDRRRDIQIIFQDPYTSLNPRHTVGAIVGAPLDVHNIVPKKQRLQRVQELLERVGLNPEHYNRYPNEFSGGQRQRIGIARALALQPEGHGRRRAGVRARRVDPGPGRQPAAGPAEGVRASPSCSSRTTSQWCGHFCSRIAVCTSARSSRS